MDTFGRYADVRAEVIAAGNRYAYVRHSSGLVVIDLADGATVVHDDEIPGLQGDFLDDDDAFRFSAERNAIMVGTTSGAVRQIAIDTARAIPVDPSTTVTWVCVLGRGDHAGERVYRDELRDSVALGDRRYGFGLSDGAAPGTPGKRFVVDIAGDRELLGPAAFVHPGLVMAHALVDPVPERCPVAQWRDDVYPDGEVVARHVAAGSGHLVVQHAVNAHSDHQMISVVDTRTGAVTGSVRVEGGLVGAAMSPSGRTVVLAETTVVAPLGWRRITPRTTVLLIVAVDGTMREVIVAEHGWFGLPSGQ